MKHRVMTIAIGVGAIVFAVAAWLWVGIGSSASTIAVGSTVYASYCAQCHGAELEGEPDWQTRLPTGRMPAPPHDETGHTWHHADEDLVRIIRDGLASIVPGYQTDMPAFGEIIDDDQIEAVIAFIKSTWPERERAYQQARSASNQR